MRVIDLSTLSLAGGSGIAENKIGLWWADGTSMNTSATNQYNFLQDGSTSTTTATTGSAVKLFTLSPNWPANLKYAFEATISTYSASYVIQCYLYDISNSSVVQNVYTSATTPTVVRSGQFTLTPNHVYGVMFYPASGATGNVYIEDASLVIFPT